jgi:Ala-tRNA(Pro) deacylase
VFVGPALAAPSGGGGLFGIFSALRPSAPPSGLFMAVADGKPVMLALPASYRVDRTKAAAVLGVTEVWLAEEQDFAATFPDCEVGAMPPFGNLYGVDVYVDQMLADDETIVMRAGTHRNTFSLRFADFARLVQPSVRQFGRHA